MAGGAGSVDPVTAGIAGDGGRVLGGREGKVGWEVVGGEEEVWNGKKLRLMSGLLLEIMMKVRVQFALGRKCV